MAKGTKIGKVNRKPGTLVYVAANGDVMQMEPKRKAATKKKAAPKKKAAAKKTVKKAAPKRKATARKK